MFRLYILDGWDSIIARQWMTKTLATFMTNLNPEMFEDASGKVDNKTIVTMRKTDDQKLVRLGDPGFEDAKKDLSPSKVIELL